MPKDPGTAPSHLTLNEASEGPPGLPALSTEEIALEDWLCGLGLEELVDVFISKEYCDLEAIEKFGLHADDFDFLGITDPAHRLILEGTNKKTRTPEPPLQSQENTDSDTSKLHPDKCKPQTLYTRPSGPLPPRTMKEFLGLCAQRCDSGP